MSAPADLGLVTLDGQVTYIALFDDRKGGEPVQVGEFPHCRMHRHGDRKPQCRSTVKVTDYVGTSEERCTREKGHGMPHVKHLAPGVPAIAWRPESAEQEPA